SAHSWLVEGDLRQRRHRAEGFAIGLLGQPLAPDDGKRRLDLTPFAVNEHPRIVVRVAQSVAVIRSVSRLHKLLIPSSLIWGFFLKIPPRKSRRARTTPASITATSVIAERQPCLAHRTE